MSVPLPPLPPLGPGRPAGRNVVDVLADEHRTLLGLCTRLADADPADRLPLAQVLAATVSRHLSAEEQYLYPAIRATVPDGDLLADRELAEDRELLITAAQLEGGDAVHAGALAAQLRRHADVAASDLLPLLLQMATQEELIRLGNRVETAEEAAPTRPHPGTPARPPWNKVVDPAIGVVDRLRDAVTRRKTFADDL